MRNTKLQNAATRFLENFALRPANEQYLVTAHTRRPFQASTGTTGTTAAEPFWQAPESADSVEEIGTEEKHCEMIVCVSPNPGDSARLLDYSV